MKYFWVVVVALGLLNCQRKLKDQPDLQSDRIFVSSFICPQDPYVEVTLLELLEGNKVYPNNYYSSSDNTHTINDALVIISDGSQSVVLPFSSKHNNYRIHKNVFPIQEGKTYTLEVSAPGKRSCKAQCTIPFAIEAVVSKIDTIRYDDSGLSSNSFVLNLEWQDPAFQKNYYLLNRVENFAYEYQYVDWNWIKADSNISTSSTYEWEGLSDDAFDGKKYKFKSEIKNFFSSSNSIGYAFCHTDEHFKRYFDWKKLNYYDNPFQQPPIVYTNVENGLGVFSGYSKFYIKL
ncbi:MAG: DUF4249 domain-containing protein [Cytophagaceae bacterium]|jgi:hypothetical protein|nr:DUF4249 domain-containing protein [Cytophagaceae bacterium]